MIRRWTRLSSTISTVRTTLSASGGGIGPDVGILAVTGTLAVASPQASLTAPP